MFIQIYSNESTAASKLVEADSGVLSMGPFLESNEPPCKIQQTVLKATEGPKIQVTE